MLFSPILIPTLNRYKHFVNCVTSLRNCKYSNQTDLFIALDYPTKESHWEGYNNIKKFLISLHGFKSITIISREINYGAEKNIFLAIDEIFKEYNTVILSEDDNLFSVNFLEFINSALTKYHDDNQIFSVSGYNYPFRIPEGYKDNIYFARVFSGWGVGLWKDKWKKFEYQLGAVENFLLSPYNSYVFKNYAEEPFLHLLNTVKTGHLTADSVINMYLMKNNIFSVFPVRSKVRNLGHDGSGVHSVQNINSIYMTQPIDDAETFAVSYAAENPKENPIIIRELKKHFRLPLQTSVYLVFLYFKLLLKILLKSRIEK